jgi:WD40 repeat protein/DNA-binding SARP family transcriptional activator/energy-coupling factor transporter ATP-binding protein EcfA2
MRFLVLGPLEVTEEGGDPLAIAGSKERMILACLIARAGRVVPVDELIEELWGEQPPRTPEKTLVSYVSRLRRDLQSRRTAGSKSDLIVYRADGYSLERDGHEIDAVDFERLAGEGHRSLDEGRIAEADHVLEAALGLWRGDAYQGYRYTAFGATEADRLDELRRTAVEDLIESRLSRSDPGQLVPELEAMVREEPLRERRWAQLMVALYRAGRQAEALRAFTRARDVLVGQLGVEPGPELQRLQAAILAHEPELERARPLDTDAARPTAVCPYKGLARFEAVDAEYFFGREQVVAEAVGHLAQGRFLAFVGPSGSGKSSLLRAGLVHSLEAGALPNSDRWSTAVIRPGNHPLAALGRAVEGDQQPSLLAVDQFEELFTACSDLVERTAFIDAITDAATATDGRTTIVLAMRADFYGRCAEHRALASLLASHQILVGPMDADELRRAIELPAQRTGLIVEDGLVDSLVSDTVDQPGGLPLLSTALLELWTHRRDRTLRLDDYLRAGGVEGAVARLAEEAFGRLDAEAQAAAKRILLRLAAPGERAEVVRRQAPLSEFDLDRDADATRAMDAFTQARLVTLAEGTVEVAHEALLREWPRLRTWLEEDAEGRKLRRNLTVSVHTWEEGGRDEADLYRGARLTAALEWAEPHEADLNELERQFLRASRTASEGEAVRARRTNRRLRGLLAGVAVLLVASLVIGDLALSQRNGARTTAAIADAGRLASRSLVEKDPAVALILAREAVDIHDSAETRSALFTALERTPAITDRMYAPGAPSPTAGTTKWIALSPDGETLAIGGAGPAIQFFDAVQLAFIGGVEVGSGTEHATFSPDSKTLVVATAGGEIESVDVATRTERGHIRTEGAVEVIAFSPDETKLVTAENLRGREYLVPRDPVTLESTAQKRLTPGPQDRTGGIPRFPFFSMAFTPNGRSLITTSDQGPTVLWNADRLTEVHSFEIPGEGVAVSPGGPIAAIIANDDQRFEGDVSFLNLRTDKVRAGSGGHHGPFNTQYEATGLAFTPDGRSVITVGNDSRLLVWDVASASVRETLESASGLPLRGPAMSPDGTTAFTTDQNGAVVVWDLSGNRRMGRSFSAGSGATVGGPSGGWPFFAMSPDGRLLAVISWPRDRAGTIRLIDTSDLHVIKRILYAKSTPEGLAFSPDSTTLAVGSVTYSDDRTQVQSYVRYWDVDSGRPITSDLPGIPPGVELWVLAYAPDGSTLAGAGPVYPTKDATLDEASGRVYLWSTAASGQLPDSFETPVGRPVAGPLNFTPDGSLLIVPMGFDDGAFLSWDTQARAIVETTPSVDGGVYAADISNDGRTLVTGAIDGIVRLWDVASRAAIGTPLTGLKPFAMSVDMSPDGSTVVGADDLGHVLLWDVTTGTVIAGPLPGPSSQEAVTASFTSQGRNVVVVSATGSAWRWDVDPSDWETRACELAGHSLTLQEWQQFLPDRPYHATCGP